MNYDHIIVGAGTAGSILANRLSEDRHVSILVLEAGGPYRRLRHSIPLASLYLSMKEIARWDSSVPPTSFWIDELEKKPAQFEAPNAITARLAGGGSSVNGMIYIRGASCSYDRWADAGCQGWGYEDILPFFRMSERFEGAPSRFHGTDGPIAVSKSRFANHFADEFIDACGKLDVPHNLDFNGANHDGVGYYHLTQGSGLRSSCARAYLHPASKRPNVDVLYGAQARRIMFDKLRATGVEYSLDGRIHEARATREVILTAGAIRSPQLLMVSGIGPADALRRLGIPVLVDAAQVGQNLQNHLRVPVLYDARGKDPANFWALLGSVPDFILRRRGLWTSNDCDAGGFVRSPASKGRADIQFVLHWRAFPGDVHSRVDFEPCVIDCASRGSIGLRSSDMADQPIIDANYFHEKVDIERFIWGIEFAREAASHFRHYPLAREVSPGLAVKNHRDLEAYIRATALTCFHEAGTCRMGTGDGAVVDTALRVRGAQGLRVADASIMPELINGNTNAACMMIGEKAATLIRGAGENGDL